MYQAVYKCRLCGEEFSSGNTGETIAVAATALLAVTGSTGGLTNVKIHTRTVHNCKDGSYGLADFQGFKKVEE